MSGEGTMSGAAFRRLLETLAGAEKVFLDPARGLSEQGTVEGYRHLAHILSYGFDCYLESDPDRPAFIPLASATKKMLGDNADSVYHFTQIRSDRAYRISGTRGNDCYLAFCVYGGKPDGEWSDRIVVNINHRDMDFDAEGGFSFLLTPGSRGKGEFRLDADSVCVIVRQYFTDVARAVPARLAIAALEPAAPPAPLTDAECARRLRSVATFIEEAFRVVPLPAAFNRNALGEPFGFAMNQRSWGTPDNIYSIGTFQLGQGEALVIQGRSPACAYWGVQTWNNYMQSYDYRYHRVSINNAQVRLDPDGSFTVIVSAEDPGHPNWVGTAGHREGVVFCRWLLADGKPERPSCRIARIDELK